MGKLKEICKFRAYCQYLNSGSIRVSTLLDLLNEHINLVEFLRDISCGIERYDKIREGI